jgi:RNA-directed DNA polymerase
LMLRSRSNTLVSVRRVTERNAGRLTAGVDGVVVLDDAAKLEMADRIQHATDTFRALPVRRVFIPKPGGKQRPLGIPVILDRVHQARVANRAGARVGSAVCAEVLRIPARPRLP